MFKFKLTIKFTLWAVFIVSLLMTLLSIVSVEYRKGASIQLPASCNEWSLKRKLSDTCKSELAQIKKAPDMQRPICYDNDRYVDCEIFAEGVLNSKQSLAGFSALSLLTGSLAMFSLRRKSKQ